MASLEFDDGWQQNGGSETLCGDQRLFATQSRVERKQENSIRPRQKEARNHSFRHGCLNPLPSFLIGFNNEYINAIHLFNVIDPQLAELFKSTSGVRPQYGEPIFPSLIEIVLRITRGVEEGQKFFLIER